MSAVEHIDFAGGDCTVWKGLTEQQIWRNGKYILLQYTGLKDRNGIEVYEGDVVLYSNRMCTERFKGSIIYHSELYSFGIDMKPLYYDKADLFLFFYDVEISSVEVIGNVYENHDLLK